MCSAWATMTLKKNISPQISNLFSEIAAPFAFKLGMLLPYIADHKNSSLHVYPIVNFAIATLLSF